VPTKYKADFLCLLSVDRKDYSTNAVICFAMELEEDFGKLSLEELKKRLKTIERHAMVAEQDFYEKRNAYKKRPNDTNLAFLLTTAETVVDRYSRLVEAYKELVSRLESKPA